MIICNSERSKCKCGFTNNSYTDFADLSPENGGGGAGFHPEELLEAAVAASINIELRIFADKNNLRLKSLTTSVSLKHDEQGRAIFEYHIEPFGMLTDEEKKYLSEAALKCPFHNLIDGQPQFVRREK